MMMETAVDYHLWRKTFAFNASVKVYQIAFKQWKKLNQYDYLPLVFTCKTDEDCYHPNGYCHARKCKCYPNYEYAQDCSYHGCKCIHQTFEFLSTFIWIYQYIPASWTQLKWPHKSWKGHIEYIRKDKRKELLYSVKLIRACMDFDHHLIYKGDFFIYFMNI